MSAVAGVNDATRPPVFQTRLCVGERIRWVRIPVQSIDPNASSSNHGSPMQSIWWPALLYKNHEELLEDLTDESSPANKKLAAIQYHHFKTKQDAGGDAMPSVARLILSSDSSRMKLKMVKHNVLPANDDDRHTHHRNNNSTPTTGTASGTKSVRNFYNFLVRITCQSSSRFHPLFREGFDNAIHLLQYYEEHAAMSEIIPLSPDDDGKEDDIPLIPSSLRVPILDRTTTTRPKITTSFSDSRKRSKQKRTDAATHVPEERETVDDASSHEANHTGARRNEKKSLRQQASLSSQEESDEDSFESNHDEESDDSSVDELIEMNLGTPVKRHENWPSVWAKMRLHGKWKWKLGSGLMTDYYYIKPQGAIKGGKEGIDFFTSEDACKEYVRNSFGWVGDDKDKENSKMTMQFSSAKRKRRVSKKFDQEESDYPFARKQVHQQHQEKADSKKAKQQKKQESKRKATSSSPPERIHVKVQKKNGMDRSSASSLSSSQSSLQEEEEEDPYLFQVLWPNLESAGWTVVKAGRWNPLDDWYYIQPGKSVENGQLGIDYFRSIEDVIHYQKTIDGAKGKQKKQRKESIDSATPTRRTHPRDPGLPYQTSDEESAPSAESSVTDPYAWGVLKPRLLQAGWKIVKASKWNRLHNWYYIRPQKSVENGQLGVDYFCEQSHVMDYQRQLDTRLEAKGEAAVKRSALLDSFEDEAAAAATEKATNDPLERTMDWWRTEPLPNFSDIWEILRRLGFDFRSGRYVFPGKSVKDAEGVHVFNRASEIQKRLCEVGIQSVLSPGKFVMGKDLRDDEWYDIARWISIGHVPRITDLQRSSVLESIPTLTSMDVWDMLQSKAGFYEQDGTFYRSGGGSSTTAAKPLMEGTNTVSSLAELRDFIARHGLRPQEASPSGRRSAAKKMERLETGLTSTDTTAICLWAAHVTIGKNRPIATLNPMTQDQQQQIPQESTRETAAIVDSSPNTNGIVDVQEEKEPQPKDPQDNIVHENIALTPGVAIAGEKLESNDHPIVTKQKHVSTVVESDNVPKSVAFTPGMNSDENTQTCNYGAVIVTEQKAAIRQDLDHVNEEGNEQGMYLTQPISSDSQFS